MARRDLTSASIAASAMPASSRESDAAGNGCPPVCSAISDVRADRIVISASRRSRAAATPPVAPPVSLSARWRPSATTTRSWRRAQRQRRRDQARLPQAGPAVAPRRQHRGRRRRAVQGDQRGLPGPVRSAAAPDLRRVRPGRPRRTRAGRAPGELPRASATSSTPSSAGRRPAAGPAAAGGRPARTCATTCASRSTRRSGHREGDRVRPARPRARPAAGRARRRAAPPPTCPPCGGRGEIRSVRQTMLGQMVNVTRLHSLPRRGRSWSTPCKTCRGEGRAQRRKKLRVTIPAGIDEGHQIRLSGEGEAGPRGGPAGNLYVAVHVTPHPALRREGTEIYHELRGLDRAGRARDDGPRSPRSTARRRSRSGPARSPGRRSGCAAGASRTCAPARAATSTSWSASTCRRSSRRSSASCSRSWRPSRASRSARRRDHRSGEGCPRLAGSQGRGERRGRGRRAEGRRSVDRGRSAGPWVELSVAADIEAVEAVSEILTRYAPGGTSVEPGFGLVDEGLGAVVDPTGRRSFGPTCRASIAAAPGGRSRRRRPPSATCRPSGCGRSAS